MKRKITSLILALAMLLSMMPAASLSVFAEGEHSLTVVQSANTAFETKQGALLEIPLADYFTDSEGHPLAYTLSGEGLSSQTKVVEKDEAWYLSFTEPKVREYSLSVTATCSGGESANVSFTVDVKKGDAGLSAQYDYDETPADKVTVYVTVSNDGKPLMGVDGTVLSHLEVEIPYFDLKNQDMGQFYRYQTENGSGPYVNDTLVERPTALHLYLYLLGKYYLGLDDEDITEGGTKIQTENGSGDVYYMDGKTAAYDASNKPTLTISGSATSMYMTTFWGHDENLMYYRNHVYPYMSPGWGATADYALLSDGDTIDIAMFSDWDFWSTGGAFACFDKDDYSVEPGGTLTFKTQKFGTQSVADGGTDDFVPITGLDVAVYSVGKDGAWTKVAEVPADETGKNVYSYSFDQEGTYYLLAMDPNGASKNARVAPATAKVVVEEQTVVIPVTGVTLDQTELALTVGGEETLTATVAPADAANKTVTWTTSNDQVAAVDNGKVTAVGAGEATITVTTADGGFKATCTVTVTANETPVPTRKTDYPAESQAVVQTGMAYLLSDLQTGKVFDPVEGQKLTYQNYYYQRSADGGKTWGTMTGFAEAMGTTIQLTETAEGTYVYRFFASHDGVHFSKDTWSLTLTVMDNPPMDFTFFVGKDYTGGYPVIKLYPVTADSEGNETLGNELTNVAKGEIESNYQKFSANLTAGRYAYRAFAKNAETGAYDVALGGMTLDLPTDTNVDGGTGGGNSVYLQCNSFYVSSKKTDGTYFTADEYHVEVVCPIMKTSCVMGTPYGKGNYTYYPTVLYAAGNACLYNLYAYPDIEGYMFTQAINQTFRAGYSASTKALTINTEVGLTVTAPENADFGLYFQWNNFNTTKVEPASQWTVNGDGTKTASYKISKGNGNYTWRMSDSAHVTQAGWLASQSKDASETFAFAEDAATDRVSHDFSQLGSQTALRDEADLQVNLDPAGYKALTGTTRVRAYRHWQLINSDAGNIMVEPDFHWNVLSGNASFETVNGGNTTANWADVTPGTEDSILTVYYDSVDVNHGSYGTHGGLYPATQPNRLGVIVVGGSGVTHGTADAHVKYNMAPGATTTRSAEWDYNYDTWFYEASETAPALTFTVTGTGDTTVEYAFVTANADMTAVKSDFTAASAENGTYTVPLAGFKTLGAGKGGTVVLKMTDSTGVSYRLVRAAEVTITAENASNPGEVIMPGDQVKLTWTGMYRAVNKISGIFNPLQFKPTYYQGETKYEGALGQYQKMNNASVTVAIPADVTFAEGEDSVKLTFTGGYTFGTMFAAANPFAFLYSMTDTGVGTNFNAVTVNYYMNHYADAVVTVSRKVLYDTALRVTDESGAALEGAAVVLTGPEGDVEAGANGRYSLGYGKYSYVLRKDGYVVTRGSFTLGSADADKLVEGVLTISASMAKAGENAWDGTTLTEPTKDTDGAWLIGTAAELAWFAKNGAQGSAKLTADIDLAGYDWTPMAKLYGTLDGQGHVIRNLYINSSSYPVGLFGYLQSGASVTRLGVTGDVTCTAKSNAQAGGIAGYMNDNSSITQCFSAVNVTSGKHGGGIAGYTGSNAVISDCYATGNIVSTAANECYLGGICGSYYKQSAGAKLTNCYFSGTVKGSGGNASYVGGLSPVSGESYFGNSYYREGCVSGESAKYSVTGLGTAKTAEELKALAPTLGGWFTADVGGINGGYPILKWQIGLSYIPVESVTLDQTELELIVGKEATLTAAAAPADASDQTVTWTSSAPEIARVENGKITALAEGTATITVTTVDGGKTAQCQVTVKPIPTYSVTLPADFTGESTVQDGADYTFTAKDPAKYIYTVTAVMGGETVEVIDNGDGTYTVKNVTGDLVIEATKVRRSEPITPVGPAKPDKPAEPEQSEKPELTAHAAFVTGYADGTVRPLNNITRSEVAAMLCRLLTESQKQSALAAGKTFSDVPADAWYRENVLTLAGMGVITGRTDGTFAPAQNITRAEFAVMLTRFAGTTGEQGGEVTFSDISGHWAESAIRAAAAQGWVKGMSDGTFRPDDSITRAEAMAMLCRMLGCEPASAAELPENMPVFSDNADTGAWYYLYVQEAACARNGK